MVAGLLNRRFTASEQNESRVEWRLLSNVLVVSGPPAAVFKDTFEVEDETECFCKPLKQPSVC